jgi:hypothetical protein
MTLFPPRGLNKTVPRRTKTVNDLANVKVLIAETIPQDHVTRRAIYRRTRTINDGIPRAQVLFIKNEMERSQYDGLNRKCGRRHCNDGGNT